MKKYAPQALIVGFMLLALVRYGVRTGFQFGPTNGEVIQQYQSQFESLHSTLEDVISRIDGLTPVEDTKLDLTLDPKPILIVGDAELTNTSMISLSYLKTYQTPDLIGSSDLTAGDYEHQRFSIDGDDFQHTIAWMGDDNPMVSSALESDGSDMEKMLQKTLSLKYLIVGRSREMKPSIYDEHGRPTEDIPCDVFLVRLKTGKIVGQAPLLLPAAARPGGSMGPGEIVNEVIRQIGEVWGNGAVIK
ncbi:hypothetical protein [Gimesia sp.]|uniref:hypothetical protein n=1 Tax=Gimesia sp. TaxID=2024833 RepID=UPI000C39CAFF|nr:hypothetical protein [Gimesia sp.]MAX37067.1 hypothetical protein [Gimesia sp.]HBL46204.1 hypothetical protein [Planctomycetaceae bacterium]|tara:strand:- start:9943 stop:10680 length:738 start_codon:yes stop_codon:yes gene_type:complete